MGGGLKHLSLFLSNGAVVARRTFPFPLPAPFPIPFEQGVVARSIFHFSFFPFPWELGGSGSTMSPFPVMSDRVPNLPSGLSDRLDRLPRI